MPVPMYRPQAVVIGEKVYVGGGLTHDDDEEEEEGKDEDDGDDEEEGDNSHLAKQVFQYDPSQDEWSHLPPHRVIWFAMVQFMGHLITVGGGIEDEMHVVTGNVCCFNEQSQKWEEFLKPMPTARYWPAVATMQSAVVASGGVTDAWDDDIDVSCATVEVYSSETSQWHTADSLPVTCGAMASVTIADTWYLLGGYGADNKETTTVLCAPLTDLIQRATSPTHQSASHTSVWKTLPDTLLVESAAATLSGSLLAMGGCDDDDFNDKTPSSPAVHVFLPLTNSWVRVITGDLPEPRRLCTAVQLSNRVLMFGGGDDNQNKPTKTVFLGSITL